MKRFDLTDTDEDTETVVVTGAELEAMLADQSPAPRLPHISPEYAARIAAAYATRRS